MELEEERHAATAEGLPISPSLDFVVDASQVPVAVPAFDRRAVWICSLAIVLGLAAAFVAEGLMKLIWLFTNIAFFGQFSLERTSPADNHLGLWVIGVPVIGGLVIGIMARYGSKAIRGHGIPEAMEQVLTNRSRIPARLTFLKPLSAAVSIGTGGPFGAEGPIIATGGALGSLIGQLLHMTASERKTLLAAGAAAGMAATFGSPVSAVLLAIELLLFEFRPRSIIPVAFASAAAAGMRLVLEHATTGRAQPVFAMSDVAAPALAALGFYVLLGAVMGVAAAAVTRIVYALEDGFERLPIHWMWWPAIGAVVVGVVGYFSPRTLGVGYDNITEIISGNWATQAVAVLFVMKFISWSVSLASGTSGGTLAPLFTIGGGLGFVLGALANQVVPAAHIDVRVAALVGMAAMFAGASRALLASTVFAFETTLQPLSLLPLLGGCAASYLVSMLVMKHSIMTEKIARRGVPTPHEYTADPLAQVSVGEIAAKPVVTLLATKTVGEVRQWLAVDGAEASHQGFPIVDDRGVLTGVLTRRDLLQPQLDAAKKISDLITRLPRFVYADATVREATDHMVRHGIGRMPVLSRATPPQLTGIITRSDVLSVYRRALDESAAEAPSLRLPTLRRLSKNHAAK